MNKVRHAVVLVLVAALVGSAFTGCSFGLNAEQGVHSSATATATAFLEAIFEQDLDAITDLVHSGLVEEKGRVKFRSEMREFTKDIKEDLTSDLGYGWEYTISVKTTDYVSGEELTRLQENAKDQLGIFIQDWCVVELEFILEGPDGEGEDDAIFSVIKVDGKWYIAAWDIC